MAKFYIVITVILTSVGSAYTTDSQERNLNCESLWTFTASDQSQEMNDKVGNNLNIKFIIDSGASENLIKDSYKIYMHDIKQVKEIKIYVANGDYLIGKEKGNISVSWNNQNIIIECLIVENLSHNLLSVRQLLSKGLVVKYHDNLVSICKGCEKIQGQLESKLYVLNLNIISGNCLLSGEKNNDTLWHRRLGHLNRKGLKILGLPISDEKCNSCAEGKSTRRVFRETGKYSKQIGDLVHSDICGPIEPRDINGARYFQVIVDDYSHFVTVKLLKQKNEAEENLIDYIQQVKTQLGYITKKLR